jgi:2-amino-4-hydroxy-6-hydroxymethyldihydropteridine diphosphokinase
MMNGIYLLLGSNLGDRIAYLAEALTLLEQEAGELKAQSSLYETAAWGNTQQPAFLNQVLEISSSLSPTELLEKTQSIEARLGRVRHEHWGPRSLDLDLLYYSDTVLETPALSLPHPQLHLRRFTLVPLCEVAPLLVHPLLKKNNLQLLQECPDQLEVHLFLEE